MENKKTIRVYLLARELGIDSKELLARCTEAGFTFNSTVDKIEPEQLDRVRAIALHNADRKRVAIPTDRKPNDPWAGDISGRYRPGEVKTGKVTKITNFGVFVELEPGLEGLLHVSELSDNKVSNPQDVVKMGDEITVRVQHVDRSARKMDLSRKSMNGTYSHNSNCPEPEIDVCRGVASCSTLKAENSAEATSEFRTSCPKCGFSYEWDGEVCNHCHGSFELAEPTKTSWERIQWLCNRAGYDYQNILKSLEVEPIDEIMDHIQSLYQSHCLTSLSYLHKILLLIMAKSDDANKCPYSWKFEGISVLGFSLYYLDHPIEVSLVLKLCKKATIKFNCFDRLSLEDCKKLANLLEERQELEERKEHNRQRREEEERKVQEAQKEREEREARAEREERLAQSERAEQQRVEEQERQWLQDAMEADQKYRDQQEADMRRAAEERQRRQDEENERQRRREEEEWRRRPDYGSFP